MFIKKRKQGGFISAELGIGILVISLLTIIGFLAATDLDKSISRSPKKGEVDEIYSLIHQSVVLYQESMKSGEYDKILESINPPFAAYAVNHPNNYVMGKLGIDKLFPHKFGGGNIFYMYGIDAGTWPKLVVNAYFPKSDLTAAIREPEFHLVYDNEVNSESWVDLSRCNALKDELASVMPSMATATCSPYDFHINAVPTIKTRINKDKNYWGAGDSGDGNWFDDL